MCKDEHWKCNPLKSTNPFRLVVYVHVYVRAYEYITSMQCTAELNTQFWNKTRKLCSLQPAHSFAAQLNDNDERMSERTSAQWNDNNNNNNVQSRHAYIGVNAPNWTYFMPYVRGKFFVTMREHNRHIAARETQTTASDVCTKYRLECISVHVVVASHTP